MSCQPGDPAAGLWRRLAAIWIDILIVYIACSLAFFFSVKAGAYFPFELAAILLGITYAVVATAWKGRTLGKLVCGLSVKAISAGPVGLPRALLRETFGKLVSLLPLFGGFLWAAFSRTKRGWHDYIAGTNVTHDQDHRSRWVAAGSIGTLIVALSFYVSQLAWIWTIHVAMEPPAPYALRYVDRNSTELIEVASVKQPKSLHLADWLDTNGQEPLEYAVQKSSAHRVVIFGETHNQRQTVHFLNHAIPELYYRAGVAVIAMETLMARDNERLEKLVGSPLFDRRAVLELAREDLWAGWGYQEYWDVIETVWKVNQQRLPDQRPLRLVGLGIPIDLPSFALLGFERNPGSHAGWHEKLRAVRLPVQLPRVLVRDAWLAREVEKEILDRDVRGIVWVGAAHSMIHCPRAGSGRGSARMGFMLAEKYGRDIFQVVMHARFRPSSADYPNDNPPNEQMTSFLEGVMDTRGDRPVGFDVDGSPFAPLRDSGASRFYPNHRLGFADVAAGYIYLVKSGAIRPCTWIPGYVTDEMFARNQPFYQSFGIHYGRRVESAKDADDLLATIDEPN